MSNTFQVDQATWHGGISRSWRSPIRPEWFAGKHEARLGQLVGMTQFGVNLLRLEPGAATALRHWHEQEDEFVYVLSGELTLVDDAGEQAVAAGTVIGFPAGIANAHHLHNRSSREASLLVIGSRRADEVIHYPDDPIGPFRRQG